MPRALAIQVCCAAGLLVAFAPGSPQHSSSQPKQDYALIYGTVWGPDDYPVPGVHIDIRRASDKKPKWQLVSNERGEFLQRVPVGTQDYVVEADVKVPKGQEKPQTTVHIDDNERRNMSLHLTKDELPRR